MKSRVSQGKRNTIGKKRKRKYFAETYLFSNRTVRTQGGDARNRNKRREFRSFRMCRLDAAVSSRPELCAQFRLRRRPRRSIRIYLLTYAI